MNDADGSGRKRFYGKYRATVLANADPLNLGRIQADVAAVQGLQDNWCLPCVPYAGPKVGFFNLPPVGGHVWIEFEGGDPNFPIWSGCFWVSGELDDTPAKTPATHVWMTTSMSITIDDTQDTGGITIVCNPNAVKTKLQMTFDADGVVIDASPAKLSLLTQSGITLDFPEAKVALTASSITDSVTASSLTMTADSLALNATQISATAGGEYSVNATGTLGLTGTGGVSLTSPASVSVSGISSISLDGGALTALVEAATITAPAINLTGAVEVLGGLLVDGQPPMLL